MSFLREPIIFTKKRLIDNPELQDKLLAKKERIIDAHRPNERDFSDIYSLEEIEKDLKDLENLEKIWAEEDEENQKNDYVKKVSSIYEGVFADQIEANAWFGNNCDTTVTSKYDDVKNKVDVVGIFKQEEKRSYLGLGVDVTFASDPEILEEKLNSIKRSIKAGHMPVLKYFQDPETGEHKKVFLPRIIIGSRLSSAEKLIELWGSNDPKRNEKLAQHPVQVKIIFESLFQLRYFHEYAITLFKNSEKTNPELAERYKEIALAYGEMYNIFCDLHEEKKDLIAEHYNEISDDIVFETIKNYTES